jgi:ubiquinone/menaquinone biosynthesis C-methylase UbiE
MHQKPNNKEFKKIYDKVANTYDQIFNVYAVKRRINILTNWAVGRCLEVGAGTGEISKQLSVIHPVVATDISPKMVAQIKKKLKIKAFVCDAERLPFPSNSFDTVIAAELIYLLDHPDKFIKEAYRALKPHGKLLISSANKITKIYDRVRALLRACGFSGMYFDDKARDFMSLNELRQLLEKEKFKLLKEKKIIIFPFQSLDWLNKLLERTFLRNIAAFILVKAEK